MSTPTPLPPDTATEAGIAEWLAGHPDFFERQPELLEALSVPHLLPPGVASLIERQVLLLRARETATRRKLAQLIEIARANDRLAARMHAFALGIVGMATLEDLLAAITGLMRDEFGADAVALRLCARPRDGTGGDERFVPPALWSEYAQALDGPRPACGPLPPALAGRLFDAASGIASCALLPLRGCGWDGLLAIGARDADRYGAGLGTLFLQRIAELVAHTLDVFLDRCPDADAGADSDARTGDA